MRRAVAAACVAGVALLGACSPAEPDPVTVPPNVETPAPSSESTTESAQPTPEPSADASASPTGPTAPGNVTDPAKLDKAMLFPEDLAGWEPVDVADEHFESKVDKPECASVHNQTMNKVASDMGATAAYNKDHLSLQEYAEIVDSGAQSIDELGRQADQCASYLIDDDGERTEIKVAKFDASAIGGEKQLGLKVTAMADGQPVDFYYVYGAHKDVVMTLSLEGDQPQQQLAIDLGRQAMGKLGKI